MGLFCKILIGKAFERLLLNFRETVSLSFLFLVVLVTKTYAFASDPINKMYVWNVEGCMLYTSPSFETPSVGIIRHGESVNILDRVKGKPIEVTIYTQGNGSQHAKAYLKDYRISSSWIKLVHNGQMVYMLDTYFSAIPPPDSSHDMGFIIVDYLKSLSSVTLENNEGQTTAFCEKNTIHFANGVHYTRTDFGPCEQCGHVQQQIYLPTTRKKEGIIMALHFFRLQGLFLKGNQVILKKTEGNIEMEGLFEYGQMCVMHIEKQGGGILLIEDFYM